MAKNFNSFPGPQLLKKSSLAILIIVLTWAFYQLTQHYHQYTQPTKLPASNAPIELYSNQTQDDLTHLFQHAIASAKQSITLVIYALTDPQIIHSLQTQSESGIQVYIVCDARASPGISHRLPRATIVKRTGSGLMHQKILIIDNKQIWVGSANMTTSSLNVHSNLVMGIENPALAQALTDRAKSMDEGGGYSPLLHRETQAGDQNLELWVLPDDPNAVKRMIDLFRSAQKSIKVAMFTWTRVDFTEELIAAAQRGVKVETVVDRYSGKGASAKIVRLLEQNNIPVRLSTGNKLMHNKLAYIDDTILINGSANWTNAAFKENDDIFIVLYPLTTEQQDKMNKLWSAIVRDSEPPGVSSAPTQQDRQRSYKRPWED
jgi:phosphatidylserine/phosphatidylglycerophosphate/cardiolipin synthase-like enzyme